jgi:hypothetical protein
MLALQPEHPHPHRISVYTMDELSHVWLQAFPSPHSPSSTCTCASPPLHDPIAYQPSSPLLSLPAELRLHIYSYLSLSGNIVDVLARDQNPTCSIHPWKQRVWYRIEHSNDTELKETRVWCASIAGLFPSSLMVLSCRQLRAEIGQVIASENGFAFTEKRSNNLVSLPLFIDEMMSEGQLPSVRTVYWPLQARAVDAMHVQHGSVKELAKLTGLKKVVLRHINTTLGPALSAAERAEFEKLCEKQEVEQGSRRYTMEKNFRTMLAIREMQSLLGEHVHVECKKTWRMKF